MSQKKAREVRRVKATPTSSKAAGHSRLLVAAGAVVVAALVGAGVLATRNTGPAQAVQVQTASSSVVSISGTDPISGKPISLADYAGKPVVLNVWASWCPGCRAEAIDLRTFVARHPEVQTIGIDQRDTKGDAGGFYRQFGWTHPSIFDPDGSIAASLGLQGLPTTYFLDRNHRVVTQIVGATNLAGFEKGLQAALAGA
ncbi:Redoxin [Gaiella occulta]|uniref:Redoxin n=1 Tax=Gaiella occulta TaxID=1002870 RepID=A0A7M2YV69_9ACTN|nr:TlpA disulfide reductase family protein [Gaiella occulta]RDI74031.1 Redoxin [Gaiella occulta]